MNYRVRTAILTITLFCGATAISQSRDFAPLPDKIITAKTVFFVNDSGTAKFGDAFYRQLKDWNRWQTVTDRGKADLVVVLSQQDSVAGVMSTASTTAVGQSASGSGVAVPITTQKWYLRVIDAKTGEKLWTADASMGGKLWRSWSSISKSLLSDIKKRLAVIHAVATR